MGDRMRRELGERLAAACGWDVKARKVRGVVWTSAAGRIVPDALAGGTMRAALEWARETTGDDSLSVPGFGAPDESPRWTATRGRRGSLAATLIVAVDTEAEAHVALAEWAAENRA